jgi:hypothetical protein
MSQFGPCQFGPLTPFSQGITMSPMNKPIKGLLHLEKKTFMKKPNPQPESTPVGLAWYKKDQWDFLRQISADVDDLEDTYEEWLQNAEETYIKMKNLGLDARKFPVDMFELAKWCREQNCPVNSESRATYAAEMLRHSYENKKQQK